MQSQEHIYEPLRQEINVDMRDQIRQPVVHRENTWSEGEKLLVETGSKKSMRWFWLSIVLPCATFFLGSFLTIFLGGIQSYGGMVVIISGIITLLLIFIGIVLWIENRVRRIRRR